MRLVPPFNPIYCCVLCTSVNKMMMGLDSWSGAEGAVLQASVARLVENHINSRSLGLESCGPDAVNRGLGLWWSRHAS
jgi:hypothetical protein